MVAYYDDRTDGTWSTEIPIGGYVRLSTATIHGVSFTQPPRSPKRRKPSPREQSHADKAAMLRRCHMIRHLLRHGMLG